MNNYERKASQIRELVNHPDPNVMADALTKSTEGLHQVAPNVAQSLQIAGSRALNYLHSVMPKPANEFVGDHEYEPTKTQQRDWLHMHEVVNDPVSVLDHVRHGSLTAKHMDALTQVHPELLNEMKQKVMEQMDPEKVKKLPSSTKKALGTFLGSPITQGSSPQAVLANQTALQQKGAPMPEGKPSKGKSGLKDLNLGQRAATETTNLEEQK